MDAYLDQDRTTRSEGRPLSACLLASALAVVTASLLMLAAPAIWHGAESGGASSATLASCAAITVNEDRLACYDRFEKNEMRPPAKGANALFASH